MKTKYILAIDQGTTGSRAIVFGPDGEIVSSHYQEFKQYFPQPGWVEHDAEEIWNSCVNCIQQSLRKVRLSSKEIFAIGITNQRETTVLWDKKTSQPVAHAIVWQCRRTAKMCQEKFLKSKAHLFRKKTGLVLDAYFSGTKIKWLLDQVKGLRVRARRGEICFGTIDSWLIWKLTGGGTHATDFTNASRTLIFNIRTLQWDEELLKILDIPKQILPNPQMSGSIFGVTKDGAAGLPSGIPIAAVMGDQQAALYGQGCYSPGTIKNTYGTGGFLVLNTGKQLLYSKDGLLSTIACDEAGKPVYALEGSIFITGAVIQWIRDQLKIIKSSADSEKMIQGLKDTSGVYFVPALTGLGAPYWKGDARGIICGLTRGVNQRHIIRAALESIAYQTKDVFDVMQKNLGKPIKILKVDGGACRNNFLMQFQADMLNCQILRFRQTESTAQGAAHLAGVTTGLWDKKDLERFRQKDCIFRPAMSEEKRKVLYEGWQKAVSRAML